MTTDENAVPALTVRKVVFCDDGGGVLAMFESGAVRRFESPAAAVYFVKTEDRRAAKRGESTATVIEWQGMPDGFQPPAQNDASAP